MYIELCTPAASNTLPQPYLEPITVSPTTCRPAPGAGGKACGVAGAPEWPQCLDSSGPPFPAAPWTAGQGGEREVSCVALQEGRERLVVLPCRRGERLVVLPCRRGERLVVLPCRRGERLVVLPCRRGERG